MRKEWSKNGTKAKSAKLKDIVYHPNSTSSILVNIEVLSVVCMSVFNFKQGNFSTIYTIF